MRIIRAIVLVVLSSTYAIGYGQTISGRITDNASGEALIGVNIFNQDHIGVTSDVNGAYSIKLPEGEQTVSFKFIGYQTVTKKFDLDKNSTVEFRARMSVESTTLGLVVVTGSQFEKKISEEMVSVDVIRPYLAENIAAPDLKAVIGKVPGVTILDSQVSIRGGGGYSYGVGSRVQLVIDDLPLLTGDLKDILWEAIPIETMQQTEVVKGASSVLYGSGAINGVINVRTGWASEKPETTFRIYQGLYSAPEIKETRWWDKTFNPMFTGLFFSHRQKVKNFEFVVGAHGSSDLTYLKVGHRQVFRVNLRTRYTDPGVKGLSYGLNGNIQYQQHGRFVLWANDTDGAFIPLEGTSGEEKFLLGNIDPWIQYSGEKSGLHTLRARYYTVDRRGSDFKDPTRSNVLFFDYRFQNEFKYKFKLTAGVQYQYIWSFSSLYKDAGTIVTHNPALYAQVEKKFVDRISLMFGIRDEWNNVVSLQKETTLPTVRAGANFKVAKKTNIRASFGQSFRFPSIGEKFISTGLGPLRILPNHDLRSEHGWSAELGVKQGFRVSNWNGYFDFALFWMEFRDMVEYQFGIFDIGEVEPVLGYRPMNISSARVAGAELGLTGDGAIGPIPVRAFLGYTFNYPGDLQSDTAQQNVKVYIQNFFSSINNSDSLTATSSILKYRVRSVFKADLEFDIWKFTPGFNVEYDSYMDRIDAEFETFLPGFSDYRKLNDKGIWRLDARMAFHISKKSTVSFVSKNILNKLYSMRPGIMEAPRSFAVQYLLNI